VFFQLLPRRTALETVISGGYSIESVLGTRLIKLLQKPLQKLLKNLYQTQLPKLRPQACQIALQLHGNNNENAIVAHRINSHRTHVPEIPWRGGGEQRRAGGLGGGMARRTEEVGSMSTYHELGQRRRSEEARAAARLGRGGWAGGGASRAGEEEDSGGRYVSWRPAMSEIPRE
jgi:hypothetical protein